VPTRRQSLADLAARDAQLGHDRELLASNRANTSIGKQHEEQQEEYCHGS